MSFEAFAQYHAKNKKLIADFLSTYLDGKMQSSSSQLAKESFERLRDFSTRGKLLRGGFVMFSYDMYAGSQRDDALRIAAMMELSQSAVLIHDDIMDNDRTRRGHPSIFALYEQDGQQHRLQNAEDYGKSMAIVAGDLGIFMTFELFDGVPHAHELMTTYSRIMVDLGIGQMFDYRYGVFEDEPSVDDIETMYALKTGLYTFVLPFLLGASLAGVSDEQKRILRELTEHLGVVFQMKDDDLDVYGSESEIGKPLGSDLREGKKTLMRAMLMQACTPEEATSLHACSLGDMKLLLEKYGVKQEVDARVSRHSEKAKEQLALLDIDENFRVLFEALIDYNTHRTS